MFGQSAWSNSTEPNVLFYNAKVSNQSTTSVDNLIYTDNRASPVLTNPNDWRVAVVRFNIPTSQIPLFRYYSSTSIPPIQNGGEHIVTLKNMTTGIEYSDELKLFSVNLSNPNDNSIYAIAQYLTMLNASFQQAFTNLFTAGYPINRPPFMLYDSVSKLFKFYIPIEYNIPGQRIEIFVTYPIARLFGSLAITLNESYPYSGPNTNRFLWTTPFYAVKNQETINGFNYLFLEQEFQTVSKFNSVKNISFQVFGISTTAEYLSSNASDIKGGGQFTEQGADLVDFVLTDFEISNTQADQTSVQFYPQGPLRWYDLNSSMPLRSIQIHLYYTDEFGLKFPITIGYLDTFTLKLEFRRKTMNLT